MKKTKLTRSLMAACSIVALSAVMYGCVHNGGDDAPATDMSGTPDPMPEPTPDPGPTDLEATQTAAADAAAAAMTASDNAAASASSAADATANIATLQTNGMAAAHAYAAHAAAGEAADAASKAADASADAAAATTGAAAEEAWAMADVAQKAAEAAGTTATEMADAALAAEMTELHIDGTVKTVGDSSVDAMAGPRSVATGSGADAQTAITGLIESMNPMGTGEEIAGAAFVPAIPDLLGTAADESKPATAYQPAAVERTFAIGKTLDSSDDMARLMIVTDYAGTNMVRVYAPAADEQTGTKAGYLTINGDDPLTTDTNNTALRSEGMFVAAQDDTTVDGELGDADSIAATAKPVELFSYLDATDVRQYATLTMTSTAGAVTTYTYATGHAITTLVPDGPDEGDAMDEVQVTASIPGPVAYEHLHFGVWAELGEANAEGAQDVAGFGIGFVQSIGDGMTGADMPNAGAANYSGNWVAVVLQGAGDDSMALEGGAATLSANLDKLTLSATLTDLATLSGTIDGSTFEGTTATVAANEHGLTPGGAFEGSFSGGFYGPKAAEAGGVFDFSSDNSGAFRGAFGGAKNED